MSIFSFKQFAVQQGAAAMKVNTDAVLLAAWAPIAGARRLLDIGTGTGVIALMAAQRCPEARVDAVEIEAAAAQEAQHNAANSPFADRLNIQHISVQDFAELPENQAQYDAIICNPPFFPAEKHLLADEQNQARQIARATLALPFDQLLNAAAKLLAPDGRAFFVIPVEQRADFIEAASAAGFFLAQRCRVASNPDKAAHRLFLGLARSLQTPDYSELTIHDPAKTEQRGYSDQYRELLQPFLTIF